MKGISNLREDDSYPLIFKIRKWDLLRFLLPPRHFAHVIVLCYSKLEPDSSFKSSSSLSQSTPGFQVSSPDKELNSIWDGMETCFFLVDFDVEEAKSKID
jgi:hypothetical protein